MKSRNQSVNADSLQLAGYLVVIPKTIVHTHGKRAHEHKRVKLSQTLPPGRRRLSGQVFYAHEDEPSNKGS